MDMGNEKKKYVCIYMLKGMLRTSIAGDTLREVYDLLEMKEVVSGHLIEYFVSGPADGLTDQEILDKIYRDSAKTTGRLTVYKFDENYDPETADEFDDEYLVCRDGIL